MRVLLAISALWVAACKPALPPRLETEPAAFLHGRPWPGDDSAVPAIPAPRRIRYVGAGVDGDGSKERPWKDLQASLRRLEAGDRLVLLPGAYSGPFAIDETCRDGTREAPIQIVGTPGAVLRGTGKQPVVEIRRASWILSDLEVISEATVAVQCAGRNAHDLLLFRCHVHDGRRNGIAVGPHSRRIRILECHIHHFVQENDAHGVLITPGASDIEVRGNHIHHNSGDSVHVVGPEQLPRGPEGEDLPPAERIVIQGNRLHDDRENGVDIKSARDVLVSRNRIWNYRPVSTSHGEGILVHYDARDVRIEENHLAASMFGIYVGQGSLGGRKFPAAPRDIRISRNYVEGLGVSDSVGIAAVVASDVRIDHNVVDRCGTALVILGVPPETDRIEIANNLAVESAMAFRISTLAAAPLFDHNAFGNGTAAVRVRIGDSTGRLMEFLDSGRMPNTSSLDRIEIQERDLGRISGVRLRDRGFARSGVPFHGKAPDIGIADE